MIEGITTGYEERFDFPEWHGPPRVVYLLASVPRSGSTVVSHLLWETGCLGAPLEYLNFEPTGPYGAAHCHPERQFRLWRSALSRRVSPNGVFGLKTFPVQMEDVQQQNPELVTQAMRLFLGKGREARVVRLRRRDREAHAISYARAMLRGIWRQEQESEEMVEPEYSASAMQYVERLIGAQEAAWDEMCGEIGLTPLELWFEDVIQQREAATEAVAGYLDVEIDTSQRVEVPKIKRQAQDGAKAWAEAHARGR